MTDQEYISKNELRERENTLPTIPLPPDHVFRSAFFTAIKYRTVRSAIKAYNNAILERAETEIAIARLNDAHLEAQRSVEKLKDAHKIHEMDRIKREVALLEAQQIQKQAAHEAKLADLGRKAEMDHVRGATDKETHTLSKDEKEIVDALLAKIKPARYRSLLEQAIREKQLSGDEEKQAREIMEGLLADSQV